MEPEEASKINEEFDVGNPIHWKFSRICGPNEEEFNEIVGQMVIA